MCRRYKVFIAVTSSLTINAVIFLVSLHFCIASVVLCAAIVNEAERVHEPKPIVFYSLFIVLAMPTHTRSGAVQAPVGMDEGMLNASNIMVARDESDGPEGNPDNAPVNPTSDFRMQEVADVATDLDNEFNMSFQMFHSVMNSLRDTRTSIGELRVYG